MSSHWCFAPFRRLVGCLRPRHAVLTVLALPLVAACGEDPVGIDTRVSIFPTPIETAPTRRVLPPDQFMCVVRIRLNRTSERYGYYNVAV